MIKNLIKHIIINLEHQYYKKTEKNFNVTDNETAFSRVLQWVTPLEVTVMPNWLCLKLCNQANHSAVIWATWVFWEQLSLIAAERKDLCPPHATGGAASFFCSPSVVETIQVTFWYLLYSVPRLAFLTIKPHHFIVSCGSRHGGNVGVNCYCHFY